jgi:hypothetical protein
LDHFDSFFEEYTSKRADVQLRVGEEGVEADPPFPTAACLAVLSATCVLLENCSNKAAYNSSEVRLNSSDPVCVLGFPDFSWQKHPLQQQQQHTQAMHAPQMIRMLCLLSCSTSHTC